MKASTFFLGLATGTVAAAITVLYSTPKSGSEIRTSVKNASADWKDTFSDIKVKVNKLKGSVSNLSKEQIPEAIDGIKQSFGQRSDSAEPTKKRLEKELTAIQDALDSLEKSIIAHQK